ncbi:Zn(2)-C6 fungal-type domain-containing protein [Fusarium falciforme]|uniref:Zn(2)-C6 fungal-type domain-containing protein n=1 Tax=Fusarium falciforme TaxID=195108 RepID=UPI002301E2D0|nr:Zn(2)-C6 fungal-type domain-containing protein [Fusarium falciforme]WAO86177.1 Zn(2)-C6 fungal-type domain-containing protein [Fusarium falciforme]
MISLPSQISPKPSGRKGSKKVRTGCITCKIRKVKCDEAKPHCLRCIKTGRKCDGYRQSPNSSPEPLSLSPSPGFGSPAETRAFDYYRSRTSRILSGPSDTGFWGGLVIKMSASEPAVRHAILAISSLHEAVDSRSRTGHKLDTRFAFREYGNAITSLRNWAQRDEPSAIPLLVCILFICVEFLADRDSAAQMHICQGRKILSGLGDGHSSTMEMVKRSLVPIYTRLSLSSFLFGSRPAPIPNHLRAWAEVPAVFATVEEARYGLYLILDEGLQFGTRAHALAFDPNCDPLVMQQLQNEQQRLLSQVSRWYAAFTVLTSMSPQSPALESQLNILRIYHQASLVWISTSLQTSELAFDAHLPAFASIISLASSVIGSIPTNSKLEPFTFETELVAPVYWTATKCRHPLLRRAALKLLTREQMRNRRENLWHVRETSVIAARIIEFEESDIQDPLDLTLGSMSTNLDSSSQGSSESGSFDIHTCSARKIKIDVSSPPTLPALPPTFTDPTPAESVAGNTPGSGASSTSSPSNISEPMSPITAALEGIQQLDTAALKSASLDSPFGVPEHRRIKNAIIGVAEDGGIWTTFFQDPEPGQTQWKVTREFLRC